MVYDFLRKHLADNGILPAQIEAELAKWELIPAYREGDLCGVVMLRGTEMHVCAKPEYIGSAITRKNIADTLSVLLEKHGFLTTRLFHGHDAERRFIERCGFRQTWQDATFNYFILTEAPYAKTLPAK